MFGKYNSPETTMIKKALESGNDTSTNGIKPQNLFEDSPFFFKEIDGEIRLCREIKSKDDIVLWKDTPYAKEEE